MTSFYFEDIFERYAAEIDDLRSDSEGKDVLKKRLRDKRKEFGVMVPLCGSDPLLLAPAFHGAFQVLPEGVALVQELLTRTPGQLVPWPDLARHLSIAPWARPMVDQVLEHEDGEDFLAITVALEYALTRHVSASAAHVDDDGDRDDDDRDHDGSGDDGDEFGGRYDDADNTGEDADRAGEDFLEQQGFDRRIKK